VIPLPILYLMGSYPKSAKCPGVLPGVIPELTGSMSPQSDSWASLSRLGFLADSNSVLPVLG